MTDPFANLPKDQLRALSRDPSRALDRSYFPDRVSDCHDLIDRLRQQIQELTAEPDQSDRHGMTRCQYAIYSILKNRAGRIVSKEQMLHLRRCGFRVRRNGSYHVVDGKRLSLWQLMMLANSAGAGNPQ